MMKHTTCRNCGKPLVKNKSYCSTDCYFTTTERSKGPIDERFWAKVKKTDSCWLWTGSLNKAGYGQFSVKKGYKKQCPVLAHRFSWELTNGVILEDCCVCHHCDSPACVNPAHLFLGTQLDNVADMVAKGRTAIGVKRNSAKLTEAQVIEVRHLAATMSMSAIGRIFGVHNTTIFSIVHRQTWQHI